jgi:hypothetical protein
MLPPVQAALTWNKEGAMTASGNRSNESTSTIRDQAHNMAGRVVDKVQETAGQILGSGQEGQTSQAGQGSESSPPLMDQATEQVSSRLDMGKAYVAETVTGVAQALRQTGQHLREEGAQPVLAQYADRGAEQIERFGGYLRRNDTSQLIDDVERFARRQPMVFAGSAFALGMLAVRFLRSGSPTQGQTPSSQMTAPYGSVSYAGSPPGTPGASSVPPGGYTARAQAALDRAPISRPSSPSGGGTAAGTRTGAGTTPGAGVPGAQTEGPTPRPAAAPSVGGTPAGSTGRPQTSESTGTPGSDASTSERTGAGRPNQP